MKFLSKKLQISEINLNEVTEQTKHLIKEFDLKYEEVQKKINSFSEIERDLLQREEKLKFETNLKVSQLEAETTFKKREIEEMTISLKNLYEDTFNSIKWLSNKYADFYFLIDKNKIVYPKYKIASKCSDAQIMFARENRILRRRNMELELQLKQIESIIPDVEEIVDIAPNDEILENDEIDVNEKIDILVSDKEKEKLTKTEILQKALDNYIKRNKTKSAIGKEYERYIGYLYETKGYKVEYHGIKKKFEDLGIDLICTKGSETLLIQCKNWKKNKFIHENAINQLFGTSMKFYLDKYAIDNEKFKGTLFESIGIPFNESLQPIFITTTKLSETAINFAEVLKIKVLEIPFDNSYPRIKCNIGKDEFGFISHIYHLPFDQMYDKVQHIKNGGFYANTIEQAEAKGFRKAFRWRGEK